MTIIDPPSTLRRLLGIAMTTLIGVGAFGATVAGLGWLGGTAPRPDAAAPAAFDAWTPSDRVLVGSTAAGIGDDRPFTDEVGGQASIDASRAAPTATRGGSGGDAQPVDPEAFLAMFPPALVALARDTVWDERSTAAFERFVTLAFDADGDGVLDDFERIVAVRSLRDHVWPEFVERMEATRLELAGTLPADWSAPSISADDLRLVHAVDQARRDDHAEWQGGGAGASGLDSALRDEIVRRFRLDDDGRLSPSELARFLRHYHAASPHADLNGDGQVDEADLRVFLDAATPIESP